MNLFNLFATLTLDNSDYEKKLDQSQKSAGSFSSKIGVAFKTGVRAVAGFATGVAAAAAAIGALVLNFVNAGSEIDDNAQKLGISTESYQYWSLVLERAGSDASNLSMIIRNLTTFTQDLAAGNGDALLTLQKLGIGYEDFMKMNTEEQLYAIVEALQGMENQTDKVTIAQEIFGTRVYQELLPLLNMEQGSLEDLREEFEGLGLIMSEDTVKSIAAVGDKLDNLGNLIKTTGLVIASGFLPEINNILDAFTAIINGSSDVETAMQTISDSLIDAITKVLNAAPDILDAAGNLLINLVTGLTNALTDGEFVTDLTNFVIGFVGKIAEILPTLVSNVAKIAGALIDALINADWAQLLTDLINSVVAILVDIPNILSDILDPIIDLFFTPEGNRKLVKLCIDLMKAIGEGLIEGLGPILTDIKDEIIKFFEGGWLQDLIYGEGTYDQTGGGIIAVPEGGSNSGGNSIWDDIGDWFVGAGNDISNWFNNTFGNFGDFGFGFGFADGGMFPSKGTLYALAGESGAEIVAQGVRGTGVANVEQIADAQYMAMQDYDLRGAIQSAAAAIVNGVVDGLSSGRQDSGNTPVIIRIGDKDFNGYIVSTVNGTLRSQGRKSLNKVTAYGGK